MLTAMQVNVVGTMGILRDVTPFWLTESSAVKCDTVQKVSNELIKDELPPWKI